MHFSTDWLTYLLMPSDKHTVTQERLGLETWFLTSLRPKMCLFKTAAATVLAFAAVNPYISAFCMAVAELGIKDPLEYLQV